MSRSTVAAFLICFVPAVALASHVRRGVESGPTGQNLQLSAGSGISFDPVLTVGTVESLLTTVEAGDVVVCGFGVTCNTSTPTSQWSDILVFYNFATGPYVTDASKDANTAYVFSRASGLATFLAKYDTGRHGQKGLSSDTVFLNEDVSGNVKFGEYEFNGLGNTVNLKNNLLPDDAVVPEPDSLIPLGVFFAGLVLRRQYLLRKSPA